MKNDPTTHQIKPQELHDVCGGKQQPLVIDVRSADEYASGHVQGAVHIPLRELPHRLAELPHDQFVVTYCNMYHLEKPQGERATALLREQGYQTRVLSGSYQNWINLLFPLEEALSAEQVQREGKNADAE